MEYNKLNVGPESPADLQWSQGAKNPRKETRTFIGSTNSGMLFSDTTYQDMDIHTNISGDQIHADKPSTNKRHKFNKMKPNKKVIWKKQTVNKLPPLNGLFKSAKFKQSMEQRNLWVLKKIRSKHNAYQKIISNPLIVTFLDFGTSTGYISASQANIIIQQVTKLVLLTDRTVPKFEGFSYETGMLLVTCYDYDTVFWLKSAYRSFYKIWEGADLLIINKYSFEDPKKYWAFIPCQFKTNATIIKLLRTQNPLLSSARLEICKKETYVDESGLDCTLPVDSHLMDQLKILNMQPYCGLSRAQFTLCIDTETTNLSNFKPKQRFKQTFDKSKIQWIATPSKPGPSRLASCLNITNNSPTLSSFRALHPPETFQVSTFLTNIQKQNAELKFNKKPKSSWTAPPSKSGSLRSASSIKANSSKNLPSNQTLHSVMPSETFTVRTFSSENQQRTLLQNPNSVFNISSQPVEQRPQSLIQSIQDYEPPPPIPESYTQPDSSQLPPLPCSNALVDQHLEQPQAFLLPPQLSEISQLLQYLQVNNILSPETTQYYQSLLYYQPSNIVTLWQNFVQQNNLLLQQQYGPANFYSNNISFYPYSSQTQNVNNPVYTQNFNIPLQTNSIQSVDKPEQIFQPPLPESPECVEKIDDKSSLICPPPVPDFDGQLSSQNSENSVPSISVKKEIPAEVPIFTCSATSDNEKLNVSENSKIIVRPPDSTDQSASVITHKKLILSPPDQSTVAEKLVTSEHFKTTLISEIAKNVNLLDYTESPNHSEDSVISVSSDDSKSPKKPEILNPKSTHSPMSSKYPEFSTSSNSSKKPKSLSSRKSKSPSSKKPKKHRSSESEDQFPSKYSYKVKESDFSRYLSTKSSKSSKHHRISNFSEPLSMKYTEYLKELDVTKYTCSIKKSKSSKRKRRKKSEHSKHSDFSKSSKHSRSTESNIKFDHPSSSYLPKEESLDLLVSPISSASEDLGDDVIGESDNQDPYNPF